MSIAEETALVPVTASRPSALAMVTPLVDPVQAQEAVAQYEALKKAIVRPDDIQAIQGRKFLKKSFWRRVATCFGLSLELVSEARELDAEGRLAYSAIYRAIAPNGRSMTGDGYCCRSEKGRNDWPEHNVRATAHTRAKNRAISDLVGGGEVSAEELQDYIDADDPAAAQLKHGPLDERARGLGVPESRWQQAKAHFGKDVAGLSAWLDRVANQRALQQRKQGQEPAALPESAPQVVEAEPARAPETEPTEELSSDLPATEKQLASIRKLAAALREEPPAEPLTLEQAKGAIADLSWRYRLAKKAEDEGHDPVTAQLVGHQPARERLDDLGWKTVQQVEEFVALARARGAVTFGDVLRVLAQEETEARRTAERAPALEQLQTGSRA